jgi:dephospho-CoA kinase
MSIVIGLTGPIGCGKSTVAAHLATRGGLVIDADALARVVTSPGRPALPAIRARFGDAVFDDRGELDRSALATIVFDDPVALKHLEAIVHPAVRAEVEARLASAEAEAAPFTVIEAIRLVEGGLAARCTEVWLVACDRPTQRARLRQRHMDPADAERRIAAQGDITERTAPAATHILRTDGALDGVLAMTDELLRTALDRDRPGG